MKTEWEVWLADGTTMDSRNHVWAEVPDGILAVRWWGEKKGINWGDGFYGDPETMKEAAFVDDDFFQQVLATACAQNVKPSER